MAHSKRLMVSFWKRLADMAICEGDGEANCFCPKPVTEYGVKTESGMVVPTGTDSYAEKYATHQRTIWIPQATEWERKSRDGAEQPG